MTNFFDGLGALGVGALGVGGLLATVTLSSINTGIACLIGLCTLAYMAFKMLRERLRYLEEQTRYNKYNPGTPCGSTAKECSTMVSEKVKSFLRDVSPAK